MYLNYTVVWQPNLGRTSLPSQTLDPRKRTLIVRRLAVARVINLSSFLELKRSEWRKRLQIFSSGPAPILVDTNAHFFISRDRNDPQKEILVYPIPTDKMHRIGIHYGGYPVPKLRMLRRASVEARKRPSVVTQTACFLWPMADKRCSPILALLLLFVALRKRSRTRFGVVQPQVDLACSLLGISFVEKESRLMFRSWFCPRTSCICQARI